VYIALLWLINFSSFFFFYRTAISAAQILVTIITIRKRGRAGTGRDVSKIIDDFASRKEENKPG